MGWDRKAAAEQHRTVENQSGVCIAIIIKWKWRSLSDAQGTYWGSLVKRRLFGCSANQNWKVDFRGTITKWFLWISQISNALEAKNLLNEQKIEAFQVENTCQDLFRNFNLKPPPKHLQSLTRFTTPRGHQAAPYLLVSLPIPNHQRTFWAKFYKLPLMLVHRRGWWLMAFASCFGWAMKGGKKKIWEKKNDTKSKTQKTFSENVCRMEGFERVIQMWAWGFRQC